MNIDLIKKQWHEKLNESIPLTNKEFEINDDDLAAMHSVIDEMSEEDVRKAMIRASVPRIN